ncbi:DedA family protein [Liquorilactobacillus uvarum]|uniref:DedA family protein n=1 Tax=Liquorilactobacillus uvarum TaxID=303240 RepID=UPI001F29298A|nr:VTT domain-containing protein [Liquorilactobacillus uvarum]
MAKIYYLQQTTNFFSRHGNSAIFLGRFTPFIRTFIPFIASLSKMNYRNFIKFNILGSFC